MSHGITAYWCTGEKRVLAERITDDRQTVVLDAAGQPMVELLLDTNQGPLRYPFAVEIGGRSVYSTPNLLLLVKYQPRFLHFVSCPFEVHDCYWIFPPELMATITDELGIQAALIEQRSGCCSVKLRPGDCATVVIPHPVIQQMSGVA